MDKLSMLPCIYIVPDIFVRTFSDFSALVCKTIDIKINIWKTGSEKVSKLAQFPNVKIPKHYLNIYRNVYCPPMATANTS